MVAAPLVQGAGIATAWLAAAAHSAAMLAGAATTASLLVVLHHLLGPLPVAAVAAVCVAGVFSPALRRTPPGSTWMVPREWARLGTVGYAAAFGFALGTGVATLLPSAALYAVLAVTEAAPSWWQAYAVMLTFAAARSLMVPLLTVRSIRQGLHPMHGGDRLRDSMARLGGVELALLAALAMELLLG